jgi:hypothetical protein
MLRLATLARRWSAKLLNILVTRSTDRCLIWSSRRLLWLIDCAGQMNGRHYTTGERSGLSVHILDQEAINNFGETFWWMEFTPP